MTSNNERVSSQKLTSPSPDEIEEVIDAVTGATWGERNRIMEKRFTERLNNNPDAVPAFCPPGTPLD